MDYNLGSQFIERSQGREGLQRQELNEAEATEDTACSSGFAQRTAHSELGPPTSMKKTNHRPTWWGHFSQLSSLSLNDASLHQVNIKTCQL